MEKQFSLKKPCANCPFRNDEQAIDLNVGRREQIIEDLLSGLATTFHCHKTVYRDDDRNFDENGDYQPNDICHCPGAIAVSKKYGRETTVVQVATRLGIIEFDHYDSALPLTLDVDDLDVDRNRARIFEKENYREKY